MTTLAAQDAVVAALDGWLSAEQPDLPVAFWNQPFDHDNPPDEYVEVEVDIQGSSPVGIGVNARTRYMGHVYVQVHEREGLGSRGARSLHDWFITKLQREHIGVVQFETAIPDGSRDRRGWVSVDIKFPFFTDAM